MKRPPKTTSFIAAVAQFCVVCSLVRVSRQLPIPQSANMTDLDDDWAVVLQNMNNTSASISLAPTSQAPTAQMVTQTAASEELKGSLESLRDLLGRLPTLERCLDVVRTQPANDTDVGYIGIPDTHTCLNSTIGDAECVNNRHYCSWNYTMRDMHGRGVLSSVRG